MCHTVKCIFDKIDSKYIDMMGKLANCLMEFWAISMGQNSTLSYQSYFVITKCLKYWYNDDIIFKHINNYSLCLLMKEITNVTDNLKIWESN